MLLTELVYDPLKWFSDGDDTPSAAEIEGRQAVREALKSAEDGRRPRRPARPAKKSGREA
jgi:hypothetical protein